MSNLLTLTYWFNLQPEPLIRSAWLILAYGVGAMFLAAIIFAILKIRPGIFRGLFKRLYAFSLTNTILGLLALFLDYESVPFLSARFWLALWVIIMIIWLVFILRGLRLIPKRRQELLEQQEKNKYLPK